MGEEASKQNVRLKPRGFFVTHFPGQLIHTQGELKLHSRLKADEAEEGESTSHLLARKALPEMLDMLMCGCSLCLLIKPRKQKNSLA